MHKCNIRAPGERADHFLKTIKPAGGPNEATQVGEPVLQK